MSPMKTAAAAMESPATKAATAKSTEMWRGIALSMLKVVGPHRTPLLQLPMSVQFSIIGPAKGTCRPVPMPVALEDISPPVRYETRPVPDTGPAHGAWRDTRPFMIKIIVSVYPGPERRGGSMSIKAVRNMSPARRIVKGRPPPASAPSAPTPVESEIEPVVPEVKTETPSIPGRIDHIESPAPGPGVIVCSKLRLIIISRTEYHRRAKEEIIQITRRIAHVHIIGRHVVDVYVLRIIHRRTRWDRIQVIRSQRAHRPWSRRLARGEPYAIIQRVVVIAVTQNGIGRINGIEQLRTGHRLEVGSTVIGHGRGGRLPVDPRRLRDLRIQRRLARLLRTGNACQHIIFWRSFRYPGKICRQMVRCHIGPAGSCMQPVCRIPAARDQHIIGLRPGIQKNIIRRILHIQ